jgi:hypothetical protein
LESEILVRARLTALFDKKEAARLKKLSEDRGMLSEKLPRPQLPFAFAQDH